MPWIKKNPHLVVLLVVALLVIAASAVVALNAKSFNEKFVPAQQRVIPGDKIEPLDVTVLEETQKELEKPATWATKQAMIVPERYDIEGGRPVKAGIGKHWADPLTKELIEDKWFMDNRLPVIDPTVPSQDPDGDGFSNADEWRGNTDPNNGKSHPPYYSKLYLKQYIRVPFRLKFNAYDGDPKKDKPEDISFQINTLEYRSPSVFLKIGDNVLNDKFKIIKFEFKEHDNPAVGGLEDVSELTLENNATKEKVVLIYRKVIDSPDSFADLSYFWPKPPITFRVPKLGEFRLKPNVEERYQVLDINENSGSIKLPSGETKSIERIPAGMQ